MTKKKDPKEKKQAWRKTKIDETLIQKLEELFKIDATVQEACSQVWISTSTYYNRCESDPKFLDRMNKAKARLFIFAKKKHIQHMNSDDERISSQATIEFLKRREPDRKDKQDISWSATIKNTLSEEDQELLEKIAKQKWL